MNQKIGAILIIFLISMMSVSPIMATELSNETIIDNSINETDNIEINVSEENNEIDNVQNNVKSDNSNTIDSNVQNVKSADETDKGYFYITKFNNSERPLK